MTDLHDRLHGIDRLSVPDLWDVARDKATRPSLSASPTPFRRAAIIAAAFLVSIGAIGFLVVAFRPHPSSEPANRSPVEVKNGDIWVQVGGGEGGTAIYRIDPRMRSNPEPMWTDTPTVFSGTEKAPELIADDYAFSPDGSEVAFSARSHQGPGETPIELYVMNSDGSGLRQLTHDGAYAGFPAWSPDGAQIAYASYRGSNYIPGCLGFSICPTDLYIVGASGGTPTLLSGSETLSETTPTWSPDGSRLAFAEIGQNQMGSIVSIRADGSDPVVLSPGGMVSYPSWSPDGRWILFLRMQEGSNHIWTVTPTDSGHHDVVDTGTDTNFGRPVWSPEGDLIAFARPYAGSTSLWTIDAAGNQPAVRVAGFPGFDAAPIAWQPVPVLSETDSQSSP